MTTRASSAASRRVEFIDLLRGWAVIVMIETHIVNATLAEEITSGRPFQYLKFLNGLVAPSFLFAAGLAFAVTTRRKIADYLAFGSPLFKQFARLLFSLRSGTYSICPSLTSGNSFMKLPPKSGTSFSRQTCCTALQ